MVDCIVISDDENSDLSGQICELASLRDEDLINTRPSAISTLASLLENDENNVPDADNRVLLNPTHQKNEDDIFVASHIARQLKQHQISGIRFLYSNLIGSVPHFNAGLSGNGCILAHSMGLGKTLQVVAFFEALFRATKLEKCLIITPANTIRSWYEEFNKWLPEPPRELDIANREAEDENCVSLIEDDRFRKFNLFFIDDECKSFEDKLAIITEWKRGNGVLLLGYEMLLSIWKAAKRRLTATARKEPTGGYVHLRHKTKTEDKRSLTESRKREFEIISKALFNPGPDIVVCDEGHRLKSESSDVVQLLRKVRTKRRLILTGYPLQNNLLEYWYMVDFIRPGHLGPLIQFKDLFVAPIERGSAADSVPVEVTQMRQRTHILFSLMKGFVHRRAALLLYQHLPPKYEYILSLKMTPCQARVYNACVAKCSMTGGLVTRNLFRGFAMAMKIANHPDVFHRFVMTRLQSVKDEEGGADDVWSDEDIEFIDDPNSRAGGRQRKTNGNGATNSRSRPVNSGSANSQSPEWSEWLSVARRAGFREESLTATEEESGGFDMRWAVPLLDGYTPKCNPEDSPKFRVLFCLIKHAVLAGDRMLVFSQNLSTLDLIEKILQKTVRPHAVLPCQMNGYDMNNAENFWRSNVDYYRFDGSTPGSSRQILVNRFQQGRSSTTKATNKSMKIEDNIAVASSSNTNTNNNEDEKPETKSSQAVLFLISTRAGSLGINLTGANRVCLMDASWNPCQDVQALARVYRFGQLKPCFVYRLVADCSLERVVYDRQVHKEALATRVVDDSPVNRRYSRDDIKNIFKHYPEDMVVPSAPPVDSKEQAETLIASFNAPVVDTVLNSVLRELSFLFARPPQRHDTFREIDPAQRLSEAERRRALLQYEVDKTEYERVVLPTFTKNNRSRKRGSNNGIDSDEDRPSAKMSNTPSSSHAPPPPVPRMTTDSVFATILGSSPVSSQSQSIAASAAASSLLSLPNAAAKRSAPLLSSALTAPPNNNNNISNGGSSSSTAHVVPSPSSNPSSSSATPAAVNPADSDNNEPATTSFVASSSSEARKVSEITESLPPVAPLPLYSLPPAQSSYPAVPSSRLPAPPAFLSSGFPMPLSSSRIPPGPPGFLSSSSLSSSPLTSIPPAVPLSVYALPPLRSSAQMRSQPTPPPLLPLPPLPSLPIIPKPKPKFRPPGDNGNKKRPPSAEEVIMISDDEDDDNDE